MILAFWSISRQISKIITKDQGGFAPTAQAEYPRNRTRSDPGYSSVPARALGSRQRCEGHGLTARTGESSPGWPVGTGDTPDLGDR
jgi:hypothetical protein